MRDEDESGKVTRDPSRVARMVSALRAIIGAPDYERYLEHVRRHHPDIAPLSQSEFVRQRMSDRYDRPGSRCC